jgi:ATP/maltotriose-dependent transcriptional regulator MalT
MKIVRLLAAQIAFVAGLARPVKEPNGLHGFPQKKQPLLPESLTPRETEVLNLLASGLTNREIAAQLGLTMSTVKSHIQNIYGKLGVDRRLQAVAQAKEMDLLR